MKKILTIREPQAGRILGLLENVATDEGAIELHPIHVETLQAMAEHLFQASFSPGTGEGSFSEARSIVDGDDELAMQVMNMAGILPFAEEENEQRRIDAVGRLGEAFGLDGTFVKRLHQLSRESVTGLAMCLYRPLSLEVGAPLWKGTIKLAESIVHVDGDKDVLARYQGYRDLPEGTLGRTMIAYYEDNDFPLPGTPGAFFSNSLTTHDLHHVLAGYPTSPLGETCVVAFDSGMMDLDLGKAMIGYIAQFQVGIQFDKGLRAWRNQFKPDAVLRAFERGGIATTNYLTMDFDFEPHFERPLAEVRKEFGIDPEGALVASPDDSWCGQFGIVGERESPDLVERKKSILQRLLAGHNTKN